MVARYDYLPSRNKFYAGYHWPTTCVKCGGKLGKRNRKRCGSGRVYHQACFDSLLIVTKEDD